MLDIPLSPMETFYLKLIEEKPGISSKELIRIFSVQRGTMKEKIEKLKLCGLIEDVILNRHGLKGYKRIKKKRVWK